MGPGCPGWPPTPQNLDTPLLLAPERPVSTLRFLLVRVHHRLLGAGRWVWVDEGGVVHLYRPLRPGVVNGWWGWQTYLPGPGKGWGEVRAPPPPPKGGLNMLDLAQTNIFTPERKKGATIHWRLVAHCLKGLGLGGVEWAGKAWVWTPSCSALMDFGGFNREVANRGAYAGVVRGIASRPKSKPKPAATPAGAPPQPHPPQLPGRLRQGSGGQLPRLGPPKHGMLIAL